MPRAALVRMQMSEKFEDVVAHCDVMAAIQVAPAAADKQAGSPRMYLAA